LKLVLSSAVLAGVLLLTGCGGSLCEQTCARYNACTVAERSINMDCTDYCSNVDSLNARANTAGVTGCAAKWTAHLNCWQNKPQTALCDTDNVDCDQSATDWQDCVVPYCDGVVLAGTFDRACQGEFDGFPNSLSLWSPFQSGF